MSVVTFPLRTGMSEGGSSSMIFFDSFLDFPAVGESDKVYVDKSTGETYIWDGSAYDLSFDINGAISLHEAEADPHPQYTTTVEVQTEVTSAISATPLNDLFDVTVRFPADGDVLFYEASEWKNKNLEELTVPDYTTQVDDAGSGVTYIGQAQPGTLVADASWKIKKVTETGDDLKVEYADGTKDFDKVWNDRATYTYS
jgi:hypothetical protein